MRGNLWDDPRVSKLCDQLECKEAQVIGALYWLWSTADQHTEDGILPGLSLRQIDRKTDVQGFADALCGIGWLADHPDGVRILNFEEHNGSSAKRRCMEAQRKANVRNVSASDADKERTEDGQIPPKRGAREEKRREETAPKGAGRPARKVPSDFVVTAEMREWAATEAVGVDVDRETAKMRDYTFSKGKTDWPATWRNWIREAFDRTQNRPGFAKPQPAARHTDSDADTKRMLAERDKGTKPMPAELRAVVAQMTGRKAA